MTITNSTTNFIIGYQIPLLISSFDYRQDDVTSFGLWKHSRFRVCIRKSADQEKMKNNLNELNRGFFENYQLFFETTSFVEKLTMRQGDCIVRKENEKHFEGTLGGFVQEHTDSRKIYGLTCHHLFPDITSSAFADDPLQSQIGTCVFTTREKSSDFAAIKMHKIANCDLKFRDEDENQTIARVYNENIYDIGVVHKIGRITGSTTGSIVSAEYYNKLFDGDNRELLFLVGRSGEQAFSEQGDSGALVFAHPKDLEHSYVNVVGMVYGNYEKEDERLDDDENCCLGINVSPKEEEGNKPKGKTNVIYQREEESVDKTSIVQKREEQPADPDHISCCYRIHPALDLFQEAQNISVRFKEDLSPSSSSSSSASSSPSSSEDFS